jgi:uncharacterized hydrophobic protein (TIGR00341 family)
VKIIEIIADAGHHDTILGIAEQYKAEDVWFGPTSEDGRQAARLLTRPDNRQDILNALQTILKASANFHIVIIPLDTVIPKPVADATPEDNEDEESKEKSRKAALAHTREEILVQVEKGAQLDSNFVLLVVLSAIVASIGLLENNLAVIVGAMVIAPLLGPNIAFSLGTSLGEKTLITKSLKAITAGISLAIIVALILGALWPGRFDSYELMARTDVDYSGTAIALASGAAASLSLISSASSVLVGVMVAVALMPPAVTIGLMLSNADFDHALGAALLLAVNIVCINLSAKLVFLFRGIKPRTWLETRKAKQSRFVYISIWLVMLVLLTITIYFKHNVG